MAKLTDKQTKKKEKIVKAMKRNKKDFVDRYGDDAKSVMYGTATKLAKNEEVEFAVSFDNADSARSFADALDSYGFDRSKTSIQTHMDCSSTVVFETTILNDGFIDWLCEQNGATGQTLCYEEFLPIPSNALTGNSTATFSSFASEARRTDYDVFFSEERLAEADEAYKKTRAYKKLDSDNKEAVDYFMQQVEKHGLEKIGKITKDTSVRYPITSGELDDFLEKIFFAEDIRYIRSLTEQEGKEDPIHKKAEKQREDDRKEKKKEQTDAEKEKKDAEKEKKNDASSADNTSDKNAADGGENAAAGAGIGNNKTFKNFKSDLKPGEKGTPAIVSPDKGNNDKMKLEKPIKGSPIKDAYMEKRHGYK